MREYIGGPLDELADLFMKALRTDDPHEKNRLIDEWNEKNQIHQFGVEGAVKWDD